mgnify:CR=1 FL=1
MEQTRLKKFLDDKVKHFNRVSFIREDPICIPHLFSRQQDIEIAGFFSAVFAWGIRKTIIAKSNELMERMDYAPYQFCLQHTDADLKKLLQFKHRTFNDTDLLYFISFLKHHYSRYHSLEDAFTKNFTEDLFSIEDALNHFYNYFFSLEHVPARTLKHIASPGKNSACKRLNMYLRWMVRKDDTGVDFGIWKKIKPAQLIIPLDVHVARVARHFKLLERKQTDWAAAVELTSALRSFNSKDPVKYDFALFALGALEKF